MAELRKGSFSSRTFRVLDMIGLGAAVKLAGLPLTSLLHRLASLPWPGASTSWQGLMTHTLWATAGLIAVGGLVLGRRRDLLARLRI